MKKIVVALLLIAALVATFAACAEEFKCDGCLQDVTSTKNEVEVLGVTVNYCDDCYEAWEAAEEALGDLLG